MRGQFVVQLIFCICWTNKLTLEENYTVCCLLVFHSQLLLRLHSVLPFMELISRVHSVFWLPIHDISESRSVYQSDRDGLHSGCCQEITPATQILYQCPVSSID